jgi:hypothetical protein
MSSCQAKARATRGGATGDLVPNQKLFEGARQRQFPRAKPRRTSDAYHWAEQRVARRLALKPFLRNGIACQAPRTPFVRRQMRGPRARLCPGENNAASRPRQALAAAPKEARRGPRCEQSQKAGACCKQHHQKACVERPPPKAVERGAQGEGARCHCHVHLQPQTPFAGQTSTRRIPGSGRHCRKGALG